MSYKKHYRWTPQGPQFIGWRYKFRIPFASLGNGRVIFPVFPETKG